MVLALKIFGVLVLGLIALFAIGLVLINFPRRCQCCGKFVWPRQRGKRSHKGCLGSTVEEEDVYVHRRCQERRIHMHPLLEFYSKS